MEIFINDYAVDFEIENEETLSDVVDNVKEWCEKRGLIFLEFMADEDHYYVEDIPEVSIKEISQLNCAVQSKSDLVYSTVKEGAKYSDRVIEYISSSIEKKEIDVQEVTNIISGLDWIIEMIGALLNIIKAEFAEIKHGDGTLDDFKSLILDYKLQLKESDEQEKTLQLLVKGEEIFNQVKDVLKIIVFSESMKKIIIESIESPDNLINMLVDIKKELPDQIKNMEEIAIAFQTGKDKDGAQKINIFVDFIMKYLKACYQSSSLFELDFSSIVVGESSFEDKNNELSDLLSEIVEVMENDDIISLSDIMEYELLTLFEEIGSFIDKLLDEISGSK